MKADLMKLRRQACQPKTPSEARGAGWDKEEKIYMQLASLWLMRKQGTEMRNEQFRSCTNV